MALDSFHFAQPQWLWGLLIIPLAAIWVWFWHLRRKDTAKNLQSFIDPNLLPHILLSAKQQSGPSIFPWLYSLLAICLVLALANPRWTFKDIEAYQPSASMVILLDLSATMNAEDTTPTRIIRARQNLEDLLNLSKGLKVGLVGFAAIPHLISPITDDVQTLRNYLPALDTDLTNLQGDALIPALDMAEELLVHEPGEKKSILLVSDGDFSAEEDYAAKITDLAKQGISIYVMGVGTTQGAPYRDQSGSLHKVQGNVVTSKLNKELLQNIAKQGHGMYIEASHSDFGVQAILNKAEFTANKHQLMPGKIRQWDDSYYVFLIPAALILLYLMRKRALFVLMLCVISTMLTSTDVFAMTNLFQNSEQKGLEQFKQAEFAQAANTFNDPYRKGVALYRAGDYPAAEEQFEKVTRKGVKIAALYNTGNAQMQQKKWQAAINSYEEVLTLDPNHEDAKHNLELAKKELSKQAQNNKDQSQQDNKDQTKKQDQTGSQEQGKDQQSQAKQPESKQPEQKQPKEQDKKEPEEQPEQSEQKNPQQQEQKQAKQQEADNESKQAGNSGTNQQAPKAKTAEQARADQWLNRIDSDIKVFLKNKFYVEDMLSTH